MLPILTAYSDTLTVIEWKYPKDCVRCLSGGQLAHLAKLADDVGV